MLSTKIMLFGKKLTYMKILDVSTFEALSGVLCGSVVKCLTRNPGVLGLSCTGSSGFFCGSVLGQDLSEPQPSTGETQEDMTNVSCRSDMTGILLKVA